MDKAMLFKMHGNFVHLPRVNLFGTGTELISHKGKTVLGFGGVPLALIHIGLSDNCQLRGGRDITKQNGATSNIKSIGLMVTGYAYVRMNGWLTHFCGKGRSFYAFKPFNHLHS